MASRYQRVAWLRQASLHGEGNILLGEVAARGATMLELDCGRCERHGRLSVQLLLAQYGTGCTGAGADRRLLGPGRPQICNYCHPLPDLRGRLAHPSQGDRGCSSRATERAAGRIRRAHPPRTILRPLGVIIAPTMRVGIAARRRRESEEEGNNARGASAFHLSNPAPVPSHRPMKSNRESPRHDCR